MTPSKSLFPALFVNHGGGPLPLLGRQPNIAKHLQDVVKKWIPKPPRAIVVVSAHWESDPIKITSSSSPSLLFDYYGFPAETYEYKYPAKGDTKLASTIQSLLQTEGLESELDNKRGLDHGVFVPLLLMYPKVRFLCGGMLMGNSFWCITHSCYPTQILHPVL